MGFNWFYRTAIISLLNRCWLPVGFALKKLSKVFKFVHYRKFQLILWQIKYIVDYILEILCQKGPK